MRPWAERSALIRAANEPEPAWSPSAALEALKHELAALIQQGLPAGESRILRLRTAIEGHEVTRSPEAFESFWVDVLGPREWG
jgi:hypothetical protein